MPSLDAAWHSGQKGPCAIVLTSDGLSVASGAIMLPGLSVISVILMSPSLFVGRNPAEAYAILAEEALSKHAKRLCRSDEAPEAFGFQVFTGVAAYRAPDGTAHFAALEPLLTVLRGLPDGAGRNWVADRLNKERANGGLPVNRQNSPHILQVGDEARFGHHTVRVDAIEVTDPADKGPASPLSHIEWGEAYDRGPEVTVHITGRYREPPTVQADQLTPHDGFIPAERAAVDYIGHFVRQAEETARRSRWHLNRVGVGGYGLGNVSVEDYLNTTRRLSALRAMVIDIESLRHQTIKTADPALAAARTERRLVRQRMRDIGEDLRAQGRWTWSDTSFGLSTDLRKALKEERDALWTRLRSLDRLRRPGSAAEVFQHRVLGALRHRFPDAVQGLDDVTVLRRFANYVATGEQDAAVLRAHLTGAANAPAAPAPRR